MSRIGDKLDYELAIEQFFFQDSTQKRITSIDPNTIILSPHVARKIIPRDSIWDLAHNIKKNGILQPLVVDESHKLIIGSRRLEAAKLIGLQKVPILIMTSSECLTLERTVISDLHSKPLTILEKATAFKKLIHIKNITKYALAKELNVSHTLICQCMSILGANQNTQQLLENKLISEKKVAMVLYRLKNKALEDFVMNEILTKNLNMIQAGNLVAQLNNPEVLQKHFSKQVKSFHTSFMNFTKKSTLQDMKLKSDMKKELEELRDKINEILQ